MCGGDGGGDGPGAPGTGDVPGGNPGGGSGGNVGPGAPGGGGGATGRGDQGQQGAVGAPGTVSGPGGIDGMGGMSVPGNVGASGDITAAEAAFLSDSFGDLGDSETTSGMEGDSNVQSAVANALAGNLGAIASGEDLDAAISGSNEGAFGFSPTKGFFVGNTLANLAAPGTGLIGALIGMAMGLSDPNNPGNVADYGGGDPEGGGGPYAGDSGFMEGREERFPASGESGLTFFGGGGSSYSGGEKEGEPEELFSLSTSPDPGGYMYKSRLLQKDDDALGEDFLRGDFDKFTRSLF